ncbi:hypothetical protein ACFYRC_17820 [Streptomyces sp. NPDC005279]
MAVTTVNGRDGHPAPMGVQGAGSTPTETARLAHDRLSTSRDIT